MQVQRVVFVEEIKTFGLEEKEIREIAWRVIRAMTKDSGHDWELDDVSVKNGTAQIALEVSRMLGIYSPVEIVPKLGEMARKIFDEIKTALEDYAYVKQFLTVYNNCNGHNGNGRSETKEIMRKVGIPVIS